MLMNPCFQGYQYHPEVQYNIIVHQYNHQHQCLLHYPARACASKGLCDRSWCLCIGYITRERSLRDLHTRGPAARGNVNHIPRRDRLPSDATYLYHGKSIEHLARFEDRNSG